MQNLHYNGTRKLPELFSEKEIQEIIKQISNCNDYWKTKGYKDWGEFFKFRDITLISTIYILGLRPKEACCLQFKDFNLRTATVKIQGKNNKVRKDRVIPIPKTLMKILSEYLKFPRKRFWRGSKYLFPSFTNPHISPSTLKTIFREKVLKPLGLWEIPERLGSSRTIYKLRHSRASHILNKQIKENGHPDIFAIANFLGHGDIRSTQVYLHTDENYREYLRRQIEI